MNASDTLPSPQNWDAESEWVTTPQQDRSRETMKRLIEASVKLFSERGYNKTSVVDIAREANLTTGALYRRFTDKEAILYTILENYSEARFRQFDDVLTPERWKGSSLHDIIAFNIEVMFKSFQRDADVLRVVESQRLIDPAVARKTMEWDQHVIEVLTNLISNCIGRDMSSELRWSVGFLYTSIRRNAVMSVLLPPETQDSSYSVNSEKVLQETIRMAMLYLDTILTRSSTA